METRSTRVPNQKKKSEHCASSGLRAKRCGRALAPDRFRFFVFHNLLFLSQPLAPPPCASSIHGQLMPVPSEDYSRQPHGWGALNRCEGRQSESEKIKKIMKTKTQNHQNKKQNSSGLENRNDKINGAPSTTGTSASLPKIDLERRRNNRALPTDKVLSLLQSETAGFFEKAEVVGKWVWIQFKEKQSREVTAVLSQLGFHWNNKRQAWQHPCGNFTQKPASYDPRERYGSAFPADSQAA